MAEERRDFFKVLLDGYSEKLIIPPLSFIRREDWKEAKLKTSSGGTWKVKIQRDSNGENHCFEDGWHDFVEAHDLEFGYFLTFCYTGNMAFHVTVYDQSACSKWYAPLNLAAGGVDSNGLNKPKCSKENLRVKKNLKFKVAGSSSKPCNLLRKQLMQIPSSIMELNGKEQHADQDHRIRLKESEFSVTMKSINCDNRNYMHIPNRFTRSNDMSGVKKANLATCNNGQWSVSIYHHRRKGDNDRKDFDFGFGWLKFWIEYNLAVGDVCTFELLSKDKSEVNFFVTKKNDNSSECKTTKKTPVTGVSLTHVEDRKQHFEEHDQETGIRVYCRRRGVHGCRREESEVRRLFKALSEITIPSLLLDVCTSLAT